MDIQVLLKGEITSLLKDLKVQKCNLEMVYAQDAKL